MTMTAQERLDDLVLLEATDTGGMLRAVASAAAQVRMAVRATDETDLRSALSAGRPRAIVVTGMGGSGEAGEVLAAVCGPCSASPVGEYGASSKNRSPNASTSGVLLSSSPAPRYF